MKMETTERMDVVTVGPQILKDIFRRYLLSRRVANSCILQKPNPHFKHLHEGDRQGSQMTQFWSSSSVTSERGREPLCDSPPSSTQGKPAEQRQCVPRGRQTLRGAQAQEH